MKNPLIIVSTYVYNKETEAVLNDCLDSLKKTGFEILVVSNSKLNKETIEKVDNYLYISSAPFFGNDYTNIPEIDFWFGGDFFSVHHIMPSYQRYGLSLLRNLFSTLDLSKSLGYEYFFYFEGDNFFGENSLQFIKKIPQICRENNKESMFYVNEGWDVSTSCIYSNIDFFLSNFKPIKKEEDYRSFLLETQGNLDFQCVERYLFHNLIGIEEDFILLKEGTSDLFQDFPDTKWNLVTGVYNTSPKYKGCLTSIFKFLGRDGEDLGMCVFSRNLRDKKTERKIEVITKDESHIIHQSLEVYMWTYNFFDHIEKIRVFEEEVLIFEEPWDGRSYLQKNN